MRNREVGCFRTGQPVCLLAFVVMWLRLLRARHWVKNFLVFVPPLCGHRFEGLGAWWDAAEAFVVFGLAASGQYVVNDVLDAAEDRGHPLKRARPVAAGEIGAGRAVAVGVALIVASLAGSWVMGGGVFSLVVVYHLLAACYSWGLSRVVLLDLLLLVALYLLRIFGGGAASGVAISDWLIAALLFPLFSLAALKRYSQLRAVGVGSDSRTGYRGYSREDAEVLLVAGVSSACLSALVLALYIKGEEVALYYSRPERLWLLCPLPLLVLGRMWLQARRGLLHEDPVGYMAGDAWSYVVVAGALAIGWLAI